MLALVTATRNSFATVPDSVASIAQCGVRVRHIFVDGNSTDGTDEFLRSRAQESADVIVKKQVGSGLYEAINQGIQAALDDKSVTHIGLLHSDDRVIPENFKDYVSTVLTGEAEVYYSDIVFHDSRNRVVRRWNAGKFSRFKLNTGWMPPHTSMIVSRNVYESIGMYDPEFGTAADYDWIVRVLSAYGHKITYFPRTTVSMQTGGASNVDFGARVRANAMDGLVWAGKSKAHSILIRAMKPARKIGQFISMKRV